ncbi:cache domain-containing protein, partial [Aliarcobacter butzleri]|uniref:cache domain-containing protein n=1 Tax=Aliarcobacter butzleri TaxID=28197 RepID=UPI003AF49DF4
DLDLSDNTNEYIFIYDINGNLLQNSLDNVNVGKNFLNFTVQSGRKIIEELINISKDKDGGFINYFWSKPEIHKVANKT